MSKSESVGVRPDESGADPILASVLQARLSTVAEEMGIVIVKSARSSLLAEGQDFATGVYGPDGEVWEQREKLPLLAIGISSALKSVIKYFGDDIHPGDVMLHNDVFSGGVQLADVKAFRPIFHEGTLVAWSAVMGHQADIGGAVKGAYNPAATEVWQEAIRITPVKIYDKGVLRKDVWDMIFANVRFDIVQQDVRAMVGATQIGERRIKEMFNSYGAGRIESHVRYLINSTERMMREEIASMPDGEYSAESYVFLDDGSKCRVAVCVRIKGDEIEFDYSGTDPQNKGYFNAPYDSAAAATFVALLMMVNPNLPHNEGRLRPVRINIPLGTFLNARFPAATGFGNHLSDQNIEAVFKAMAKAVPERVMAGVNRHLCGVLVGTDPRRSRPYNSLLFLAYKGGAGATKGMDGYDYHGLAATGGANIATDYERFEVFEPHTLEKNEYAVDSGGAGQWRGGLGVETVFKTYGEDAIGVMLGDGVVEASRAFGLFNGKAGSVNRVQIMPPGGTPRDVMSKELISSVLPGSMWYQVSGGGGGYGDPRKRPVEKVLEDVRNGVVSIESAAKDYGVFVNGETMQLDERATKTARESV